MKRNWMYLGAALLAGLLLMSGCKNGDDPATDTDPTVTTDTAAATDPAAPDTDSVTAPDGEITANPDETTEPEETTAPEPELGARIDLIARTLTAADGRVVLRLTTDIKEVGATGTVKFTLSDKDGVISEQTMAAAAGETDVTLDCPDARIAGELILTAIVTDGDTAEGNVLDEMTLKLKNQLPQLTADGVRCVVAAMTLDEKAHLVTGIQTTDPVNASGGTYAIDRLGVPSTTFMDGTAGVRYETAVWYPAIMNLASSWDASLIASVGQSTGEDALGKGFDIILSPGLNIQKNPLCGRHFEYFSEDPVLTGFLAAAYTEGMQSTGVGVALKHYAVNNQETARGSVSANLTERALREIYLKAFGIAVKESSPYSIMSSYNCVNGTHTSVQGELLNNILRGEFGFEGMVMSDWGAAGSMVDKINATNDINMPGNETDPADVIAGYEAGLISEDALNAACYHILGMVVRTPTFNGTDMGGGVDFATSRAVSEEAAGDTMVLLKNEGSTLPLAGGTSVAVYGNGAVQTVYGGFGAASVTPGKTTSIMDGLRGSDTLSVYDYKNNPFRNCAAHSASDPSADVVVTAEMAASDAVGADAAVIVISRDSREGWDRTNTEGDFKLNTTERDMIERVSAAFHAQGKKVVVLLNTGSPIEVVSWRDLVDAILWVGYGGEQVGSAVEKVLTGEVNPSAKLTCTWPTDYTTVPDYAYFPGNAESVYYYDDIYVGYRYYDTFGVEVAYEFGYGLSYTTFAYSDFSVKKNTDGTLTVLVTVTNTGSVAGREVVQLYVGKPETTQEQATRELCGFGKTALLAPGASETLTMTVSVEALETYDTANSRWILDKGDYTLTVAASLTDTRHTTLVTYGETTVVLDTENYCTPEETFDYITKATYEVPTADGRVNLAYGKEAWSNYAEGKDAAGTSFEASRAVDGDFVTRWSGFGLSAGNHLWQVDLGEVYAVGEVVIRWESLNVPFTVLVSEDGEHFTEVGMYSADERLHATLNLYGAKARYIRLDIARGSYVSIFEFMAYEATEEDIAKGAEIASRTNLAEGKPVTATTCEGSYVASNAVDGSTSTRWGSVPGGEAWLQVDLETVCHITGLKVYMESSWQPYRIEYSTDGVNYVTLCSCEKDELFVTMEELDIQARYVRLVREGESWFSIYEVCLYGE